ncbi:CDP-alcohol phosphatidyltransferase family protein [Nakamurella sp.]|uniref:CDP-alcohol phosphatidyltransferase family protein n=1 Tax=Nakamurella sp. TaxID=1869182 RepID=UPI003B3A0E26
MGGVPGVRFLPNAITVMALCAGLTSVAFAMSGQWLLSVGAIATAAVLDSLDGPAARWLRSQSRVGAELDSLSDCISFGVAPALVMYVWLLRDEGQGYGWVVCLLFAVCAALRLARFNSLLDDEPKPWAKGFFTGVPTPAGGLIVTAPLLLTNRLGPDGPWAVPWVVSIWIALIGFLMVSRVPTIALKSVRLPPQFIVPMLILLVLGVAALFYQPELVTVIGMVVYLLHIPYAVWKYNHLKHHPELWRTTGGRTRRSSRRVRMRMPRRQRVAGRLPDGSPAPHQQGTRRRPRTAWRRLP